MVWGGWWTGVEVGKVLVVLLLVTVLVGFKVLEVGGVGHEVG